MDSKPIIISIYVLIDPRDEEIRYVGKTKSPKRRLGSHLRDRDDSYRTRWIGKLGRMGMVPRMQVIQEVPASFEAEAEKYWIAYFRAIGCRLTNSTDGGEGNLGWCPSEETRAKMSAASQRTMANPAARQAVSAVHKGKIISSEHKAVVSKATTERWKTWRANGSYTSPETRAKLSASQTGKRMTPETVAKMSATLRGKPKSPEHRAALAAHLKAVWSNYTPEQRLALNAKAITKREANRTAKKEALCQSST